eukprot:GGOE01043247.1.p1 GENE.GGOE01043247.1~~GGOE01043247.1.p1  ORF type:complete len:297 (-),score=55.39 GGOE01043247.1:222-1112(-)
MLWPRRGTTEEEEADQGLLGDDQEPTEGRSEVVNVWNRVFGNRYEAVPTDAGGDLLHRDSSQSAVLEPLQAPTTDNNYLVEDDLGDFQEAPPQPLDPRELLQQAMQSAMGSDEHRQRRIPPPPQPQPQRMKSPEPQPVNTAAADAELAQRLQREWRREMDEQARRDEELARRLQQEFEAETSALAAPVQPVSSRTLTAEDEQLARQLQRELELESAGALAAQSADEELARRLQAEFDGEGPHASAGLGTSGPGAGGQRQLGTWSTPPAIFGPPMGALAQGQPYHWSNAHQAFHGGR